MIIVDSTELREDSKLPRIPNSVSCAILEQETGADLMITPIKAPPVTPDLIKKHIESGAVLVQRKTGMDFINSFGSRLNDSLFRMRKAGARQSQCILLFVGSLTFSGFDGTLELDGHNLSTPYSHILGAFEAWSERGGVVSQVDPTKVLEWISLKERHVIEIHSSTSHEFYAEHPNQFLERVDDWRKTIATFPGIGADRANKLRDAIVTAGLKDDLLTALVWLTHTKYQKRIKGIGAKTHKSCREYLGVPDGWNISVDPIAEENNEK